MTSPLGVEGLDEVSNGGVVRVANMLATRMDGVWIAAFLSPELALLCPANEFGEAGA